ncbi:MAG: DinB family protein [Chitinophagaceae bacterium]|nr:DinB family protein [Chitinophagaceae bacterium]
MEKLEVWLRGPMAGVPALLQPVAHALLQAREEVNELLVDFPDTLLNEKPAGVASPGFHLKHIAGVLDRLFTYARAESLSKEQLSFLKAETVDDQHGTGELIVKFNHAINTAVATLPGFEKHLNEARGVGRAQIPSTVMGLLFHSAEHTQRHVGQLIVTVRFLQKQ